MENELKGRCIIEENDSEQEKLELFLDALALMIAQAMAKQKNKQEH